MKTHLLNEAESEEKDTDCDNQNSDAKSAEISDQQDVFHGVQWKHEHDFITKDWLKIVLGKTTCSNVPSDKKQLSPWLVYR